MTRNKLTQSYNLEQLLLEADLAHSILAKQLYQTPCTLSPFLSEKFGKRIYLKWDNKHRTGSFKERGACYFLSQLSAAQKSCGVCAASAGNHALALSYHAAKAGIQCKLVMPIGAPLVKVQSSQAFGAEVILHGDKFDEAYIFAKSLALQENRTFIPAFDHPLIVAGQASCGKEIVEQIPKCSSIIVPFGGGGLISGVALAAKKFNPNIKIIGVKSIWSRDLSQGKQVKSTLADGIAVKSPGEITSPLIQSLVDQTVFVDEEQIATAIVALLEKEHAVIEGAGAVGVAAVLENLVGEIEDQTVILISGSNIDVNVISRLIDRSLANKGRLVRVRISAQDKPGILHAITGTIAKHSANILEIIHDRSFSQVPGEVSINLVLEVKSPKITQTIFDELTLAGFIPQKC